MIYFLTILILLIIKIKFNQINYLNSSISNLLTLNETKEYFEYSFLFLLFLFLVFTQKIHHFFNLNYNKKKNLPNRFTFIYLFNIISIIFFISFFGFITINNINNPFLHFILTFFFYISGLFYHFLIDLFLEKKLIFYILIFFIFLINLIFKLIFINKQNNFPNYINFVELICFNYIFIKFYFYKNYILIKKKKLNYLTFFYLFYCWFFTSPFNY